MWLIIKVINSLSAQQANLAKIWQKDVYLTNSLVYLARGYAGMLLCGIFHLEQELLTVYNIDTGQLYTGRGMWWFFYDCWVIFMCLNGPWNVVQAAVIMYLLLLREVKFAKLWFCSDKR